MDEKEGVGEVVAVRTLRRQKNATVEGGSVRRHSVS